MKQQRRYLDHILECIEVVQSYTAAGRESLDDAKTQDAVMHRLQLMAESSLRLSSARTAQFPDVGWQHIRGFRNRLVHEYFDVDPDLVRTIIENNLPLLKAAVEQMLAESN